jgi:hypothetical protein
MKSITKNKIVLFSMLIVLFLGIGNANSKLNSNEEISNSMEVKAESKTIDHNEPKTSGDNDYIKVWDSGTAFSATIHSVCTGDQDSDGKKEIIFGHSGEFAALEYNSTYANYTAVWSDWIGPSVITVCTGDQDGDGKREIIGGGNDATLYIYEYNDNDNGYAKVLAEYLYSPNFLHDICIGDDVDKDGNEEIIFTVSTKVYVYEYNFTDNGCYRTWDYDFGFAAYGVCGSNDLDGDGKKEIISNGGDKIHVFENTANNTYSDVWNSGTTIGDITYSVCIGEDLDGDGKKEIIAGTDDYKLYIFEFNGTDNGYNKTWDSGTTFMSNIRSVCSGEDLDGDGKKEIIAGSTDGRVNVFEFNGTDNGFERVWESGATILGAVESVCFGDDLDGNGKKEIIAGAGDGKVYIFEHDDTTTTTINIIDDDDDDERSRTENIVLMSLIIGSLSILGIVTLDVILHKKER